jgi:hypothetical protein
MIMDPENSETYERMNEVCEFFLEQGKPRDLKDSTIQNEKSFENMLSALQESGIQTKDMTVFEFYSKIEYFENKYNKLKHGSRKQI